MNMLLLPPLGTCYSGKKIKRKDSDLQETKYMHLEQLEELSQAQVNYITKISFMYKSHTFVHTSDG